MLNPAGIGKHVQHSVKLGARRCPRTTTYRPHDCQFRLQTMLGPISGVERCMKSGNKLAPWRCTGEQGPLPKVTMNPLGASSPCTHSCTTQKLLSAHPYRLGRVRRQTAMLGGEEGHCTVLDGGLSLLKVQDPPPPSDPNSAVGRPVCSTGVVPIHPLTAAGPPPLPSYLNSLRNIWPCLLLMIALPPATPCLLTVHPQTFFGSSTVFWVRLGH